MARKRRTARQSANITEYRRLRRNLMSRLRYREKQGFKVDYTTLPKSLENATARDIQKLSKATVKKNRYGEVVVTTQGRATRQYTPISKEDVLSAKEILKKYGQDEGREDENKPTQRSEPVDIGVDYVGMLYSVLTEISDRAQQYQDDPANSTHYLAEQFYYAYSGLYENLFELLETEYDRVGEERLNRYYSSRWAEISEAVSGFLELRLSDPDQVIPVGESMIKYLLICP